jgi:hemoglobin-like flavoprotein
VTSKHYAAVGAALLWTLEQGLGSAFTPQVKDAWTATYTAVADTMRGAAEEPEYAELSAKSGRSGAAIEQYEGRA